MTMPYIPKIVKCRMKTGGKTIEQIRAQYTGQGLTRRDFENMQKAGDSFDGLIMTLSLWDYDGGKDYHLHNWEADDDERVMMGIYYAEQTHPFPQYKNDLDGFVKDWKAQTYDPGAAFIFPPADVEEIETLSEEIKPPPPVFTPPQRKKHRRKKGSR